MSRLLDPMHRRCIERASSSSQRIGRANVSPIWPKMARRMSVGGGIIEYVSD
jgi:hypothetical protein